MSLVKRQGLSHGGYVTADEQTYPCHFTNMSRSGATLIFDGPIDLPERFTIRLSGDRKIERTCTIKWIEDQHIGVAFE